jgi:GT2 family glycosyltransferase
MQAVISVLIPSARGNRKLVELVERLRADAPAPIEFLIADNGIPSETAWALNRSGARVVGMSGNLGFGAAVNRIAALSRAHALVILNDDVVPHDGFIVSLVEHLDQAEMVAGVLVQAERPDRIESAGIEVDVLLGPHDYLHGEALGRLAEPLAPPLGPCGGAAAFRRSSFAAVGGFDEGFFAYCEDVDLALRLRAGGARCALAPRALALHAGSDTLGYRSLEKARLVGFGRGYLLRKYGVLRHPLIGPAALSVELAASLALARRHRSLEPALARLRGWHSCSTRGTRPPRSVATVGLARGMRVRHSRSRRTAAPV